MSNTTLTADIIAKEALMILDNELVMAKQVHRGHEKEFGNSVNGYEPGATVTIRRPTDFTVRDGATASNQDVVEGSTSITVDKQKGVDFSFTSQELTLNIRELSERVIKPAMVQLANQVDRDLMDLYKYVPNWVGTPGQTINSYTDFAAAPQRLDEYAVPQDQRSAALSPSDHWGLLGNQTGLYIQNAAQGAYREGSLGKIGGIDTYMSQNVPTHTVGDVAGTVVVSANITAATISYADVKSTMTQAVTIAGLTTTNGTVKAGDTLTFADVYAVNPVTKARLPFLKQFTVMADATAAAGIAALTIYPAMIWSGAQQNIDVAAGTTNLLNKGVTFSGTSATGYRQNLVFHKNAFSLAMVPLIVPQGAVNVSRQSYKGLSVRLIPYYDGANDISKWRLDILYGVKAQDPRLATRASGAA